MKKIAKRQSIAIILITLIVLIASIFTGCTCSQIINIGPGEFSQTDGGQGREIKGPDAVLDIRPDAAPEPSPEPTVDAGEPTPEPQPEPIQDGGVEEIPERCHSIEREPCEGRLCVKESALTVSLSPLDLSKSHTKGAKAVEALEIYLSLDEVGDGMLRELTIRFYADSKGGVDFSPTGDIDASTIVESATLYAGNTIIAGPQPLQLVDSVGDGFTPDQDFHQVTFKKMRFGLQRNRTDKLMVKINLRVNFTGRRFVAVGLNPQTDAVVEDDDARVITNVSCNTINMGSPHKPELRILERGQLSIEALPTNSPQIIVGGQPHLIGKYKIFAKDEAFRLKRLTFSNDFEGLIGDKVENTPIVYEMQLVCPDENGVDQSMTGTLTNGEVTFSGLRCFVPKDRVIEIELRLIPVVVDGVGFALSGQQARIGLRGEQLNSGLFQAEGINSGVVISVPDAYTGQSSIGTYTLRRARPNFRHVTQPSILMPTSGKAIYSWQVCAEGGYIGIARYNLSILLTGFVGQFADINNFQVVSMGQKIASRIIAVSPTSLVDLTTKGLKDLYSNPAGLSNGGYPVVIAFKNEEVISHGQCKTYQVRADVIDARINDTLSVEFQGAKEVPLSLPTQCRNPLTGQVYGTIGSIYSKPESFLKESLINTMVLWSDFSGGRIDANGQPTSAVHTYPTITNGKVQSNSSTCDWTNGRRTNLRDLRPWQFKK